jgi:hypothetical protein
MFLYAVLEFGLDDRSSSVHLDWHWNGRTKSDTNGCIPLITYADETDTSVRSQGGGTGGGMKAITGQHTDTEDREKRQRGPADTGAGGSSLGGVPLSKRTKGGKTEQAEGEGASAS